MRFEKLRSTYDFKKSEKFQVDLLFNLSNHSRKTNPKSILDLCANMKISFIWLQHVRKISTTHIEHRAVKREI
jgi:hypothetical protein